MSERILLVEDEPAIVEALTLVCEQMGLDVCAAGSLAAARTRLRESPPALVLLDMLLPDGDGLALCREIKAAHPHLPVVAVTAFNTDRVRQDAFAAGADEFVAKPFDPDTIEAVIAALLASRA